jgi:branched-chain amino acid transport system ATP-binding protein
MMTSALDLSDLHKVAIDEPSLGLAPNLVHEMLQTIKRVNESGVTILIVEQNLSQVVDESTSTGAQGA